MNNEKEVKQPENTEMNDRREALKKLGKFSAYVAPFTVIASPLRVLLPAAPADISNPS